MDNNIEFKINKNVVIVILCVIIGALIAYVVLNAISSSPKTVVTENNNTNNTPVVPVTVVPVAPDFIITPDPTNPDLNVFTSTKAGITFKYLKYFYSDDENNPGINRSVTVTAPMFTDVAGNEAKQIVLSQNSYLEVYAKDPKKSLEAAIKEKFLTDIPTTQCLTSRVRAGADDAFYTPTNQISFVRLNEITPDGCPKIFDFNNSSAAFFSFANQPDKFFYVIGEADTNMPLRTATGDPFFTTIQSINQ